MNRLSKVLLPALIATVMSASSVAAQSFVRRTIGFETDCAGGATPNSFDLLGYKQVPGGLYAACGVSSITSGGAVGTQQLHNPTGANINGQTGDVVLAGALATGASLTFGDVVIIFSPEVNEVSFDVLDLNNPDGLTITLQGAGGGTISVSNPKAPSGTVQFSKTSPSPIQKVTISYQDVGLLDGWFIDALSFNVWKCGDNEIEAGAGETCEDGNDDYCDNCGDCKATSIGCLNDGSCIADGQPRPSSAGCEVCVLDPATTGNDDDWKSAPNGQTCDDGQFCTVDDQCNAGTCASTPRACPDGDVDLACTVGTCNQATNQCEQALAAGCLINGACVLEGQINPSDRCEQCNSTLTQIAWSKVSEGTTCGDPSCSEGVLTPAPRCDAAGACDPQPNQTCEGAGCADAVSCTGACESDADCLDSKHCENGKCVPDGEPGVPCERGGECGTGFCADGVCCDNLCNSDCEACNIMGKYGSCTYHTVGTDPENECGGAAVCSGAAQCVSYETRGNGLCSMHPRTRPAVLSSVFLLLVGLAATRRRRSRA